MTTTFNKLEEYKKEKGRKLSPEEIQSCLDKIKFFPSISKTVQEHNLKQHKERLRNLLMEVTVSDDIVDEFIENVVNKYYYSLVTPGEPEGNIASGALSAPATQMNLSAYHSIGISGGNSLKSLQDIIYRRRDRDPENLVIHFKNDNMSEVETKDMIYKITGITIRDLLDKSYSDHLMTINDLPKIEWLDEWKSITGKDVPENTTIFLRLKFNVNHLYAYKVSLIDIKNYLESIVDIVCIPSPTILGYLDIFLNEEVIYDSVSHIKFTGKIKKVDILFLNYKKNVEPLFDQVFDSQRIEGLKNCYVKEISVLTKMDPREQKVSDNQWYIYCDATELRVAGISNNKIITFLQDTGLNVIESVYKSGEVNYLVNFPESEVDKSPVAMMRRKVGLAIEAFNNYREKTYMEKTYSKTLDFPEGQLYRSAHYVFVISASNILREVLGCELVDQHKTILKNPYRVYLVFGIEAARNVIIREIFDIFTESGNCISPRHVTVIADHLCYLGTVIPAGSSGVSKLIRETLSEASSETPLNYFQRAALSGAKENIYGTSSCVLMGTKCMLGTGATYTIDDPDIPIEYFNSEDNEKYVPNININTEIGNFAINLEEMVKPGDFNEADFTGEFGFREGTDDDELPIRGNRAPNMQINDEDYDDDYEALFEGDDLLAEIGELYEELYEI